MTYTLTVQSNKTSGAEEYATVQAGMASLRDVVESDNLTYDLDTTDPETSERSGNVIAEGVAVGYWSLLLT